MFPGYIGIKIDPHNNFKPVNTLYLVAISIFKSLCINKVHDNFNIIANSDRNKTLEIAQQ